MDKARRDHLRSVIGAARRNIQRSLEQQLARFGLFADGAPARPDLTPEQEPRYRAILAAVMREARAVGATDPTAAAVRRFVREAGGTWVNRVAALRALEARGLLTPAAALVSDDYGGISLRASRLRDQAAYEGRSMSKDEALRGGLADACRELSASVRVLFDLDDEASLLWPGEVELLGLLRSFSSEVTDEDWRQPDILGWVYQYYNTEANADLKKRKKVSGFKLSPDDVPVANQFYTPHWVVRVLTDNTLGRLWLESRGRCPRLTQVDSSYRLEEVRTGVPHAANERPAFKAWIAEEPDPLRDASVERLCRFLVPLPSEAPARERKRARDVRVLDPACGSGHFLLYAFDVLFAMWREDEPDLDPREIPALVLEHNLYGVDIDLRAAQLAAFNLYLKARTTLATIDPVAALRVSALNIVVADAHLGDDPRKAAFLARYAREPAVQAQLAQVLGNLDHANVLGSLLKVRGELEGLFGRVDETQRVKARKAREAFARKGQQELIASSEQREIGEVFVGVEGRQWTLAELLVDLRAFEREVASGQDVGARLFGTDLGRAAGVLSMLSRQYDVVLMNPPYGDMPQAAKDYLKGNRKKKVRAHYPRTSADLYAAFIEQALDLTLPLGFLGALVPWTYTYQSTLALVRTEVLSGACRCEFVQEYGYGVLDGATVGTVGTVVRRLDRATDASASHRCVFERLSAERRDVDKEARFHATLPSVACAGPSPDIDWFAPKTASLGDVPGMPYAYWASDSLRALFRRFPALDKDQKGALIEGRPDAKIADVKVGLATADDPRFLRFRWEVPKSDKWIPFFKGGKDVRYYARTDLVVNWANGGREVKDWLVEYARNHPRGGVLNEGFFFRSGVTWPPASWRLRKFGLMPVGSIFAHNGSTVFPTALSELQALALLNSAVGSAAMLMQTPERKWEVGMVGALPIPEAAARSSAIEDRATTLSSLVRRSKHEGDETCRDFVAPDLLRHHRVAPRGSHLDLGGLLEICRAAREARHAEETRLLEALDTLVDELYELSDGDRKLIRRELAHRRQVEDGQATNEDESHTEDDSEDGEATFESEGKESVGDSDSAALVTRDVAQDLTARWISHYVKQTIEADDDGIVPVLAVHGEPPLVDRLLAIMTNDLGREDAKALAEQAPAYLRAADLGAWVESGFFPWHVALYQNRPIFWLLSSEGFERTPARITFRAYLHALRVTADTLPRLVSYYLDPVLEAAAAEAALAREFPAGLAGREKKNAEKAAHEWSATVDALKGFRDALQRVIQGPPTKERVPDNARWLARTIAGVRGGRDVGHGYLPDVDHGVRVNIKPLAEAKLLPRATLPRLGG